LDHKIGFELSLMGPEFQQKLWDKGKSIAFARHRKTAVLQ
jgi:hypothetical protein